MYPMYEKAIQEIENQIKIINRFKKEEGYDMTKEGMNELSTYQIYLMILGYLAERHDNTEMIESMLIELYKRARNAERNEEE